MKKAIFVDGQSFFNIAKSLGIGSTKYNQLMNVLKEEVGECREIFGRPFYTINHTGFLTMKKPIVYAGFELFPTRTGNGKDDKEIITRIEQLPDGVEEVSEIVLVAADSDYIPALQKQAKTGKKIFIVATELQSNGRFMISSQMKEEFNFVELGAFKERIMRSEWRDRLEENDDANPEGQKVNRKRLVNFEMFLALTDNAGVVGNFLADISDVVAKYPGMKSHFDSKPAS